MARRIRVSRNVVFVEHIPFYSLQNNPSPTPVLSAAFFRCPTSTISSDCPHLLDPPPQPLITKVYVHRQKPLSELATGSDHHSSPNPPQSPSGNLVLEQPVLRRSTRSKPSDRFGFFCTYLSITSS